MLEHAFEAKQGETRLSSQRAQAANSGNVALSVLHMPSAKV